MKAVLNNFIIGIPAPLEIRAKNPPSLPRIPTVRLLRRIIFIIIIGEVILNRIICPPAGVSFSSLNNYSLCQNY